MNMITVNGKNFSKVEFFDYVHDTAVEADWTEPGSSLNLTLNVLYAILDTFHWKEEYRQWVADGAGAKEAEAELHELLKAFPVA